MTAALCFPTLYHQHLVDTDSATALDLLIDAYLNNSPIDAEMFEKVLCGEFADISGEFSPQGSPWAIVEKWRELLSIVLIARDVQLLTTFKHRLMQRAAKLSKIALWREFQLLEAYGHLAAVLLEDPSSTSVVFNISQMENGAAPLESGGHWAWGDIPHPIFHAELGILWSVYATLTSDQRTKQAAERLAEWQINTLDHEFIPFSGLYAHEGNGSDLSLLMNTYVLFDAVSKMCGRSDFAYVAEQQLDRLAVLMSLPPGPIPIHSLIFKGWCERHLKAVSSSLYRLPGAIQDVSLALAGSRSDGCSAVATLFGGGTGMGCFHRGDVQIVNFGPQHFPLGDCLGFGLEGAGRLLAAKVQTVSSGDGRFVLEGTCRMTARPKDQLSLAGYRHGDPSGCWLDTRLEMQKGHLFVETAFNGIFDDKLFAFVFFVKAAGCIVDGKQSIKARSFQHYQGEICPVHFTGEHASIGIEAANKKGEMRVIPLGGGENFWGADYLIAYQCHADEGCYRWQLA